MKGGGSCFLKMNVSKTANRNTISQSLCNVRTSHTVACEGAKQRRYATDATYFGGDW